MEVTFQCSRRRMAPASCTIMMLWTLTLLSCFLCTAGLDCEPCECSATKGNIPGAVFVNCSKRGLDKIPEFFNGGNTTNVTLVDLTDNDIQRLEDEAFRGLPNIKSIYLSRNKISYIGSKAFPTQVLYVLELNENQLTNESFNELTFQSLSTNVLDLSRNLLPHLPKELIHSERIVNLIVHHNPIDDGMLKNDSFLGYPDSIVSIDLSDCNLREIETGTFNKKYFFSLESVYLDNNNFGTLKPAFFENAKITEKLSIQNSNVRIIERNTFNSLRRVKHLYLNRNNLGTPVDRKAFKGIEVTNLELMHCNITWLTRRFLELQVRNVLDLSFNDITILQKDSFEMLKDVRKLVLSNCNITEIRQQPFTELTYLEELYLDYNKLTNMSYNFLGTIKRLRTLDIAQNNFNVIPNITGLDKLYDLYASGNDIKTIQSGTFNNTRIRNLRLSLNKQLHSIAEDALLPLNRLNELDLSWSALTKLPSLQYTPNLVDLNLVHSDFEELPSDLCQHIPKLSKLTANNNQLKSVPDLQNCTRISIIFLDFNQIKKIGKNTFSGLERLTTILLHNNEIEEIHPEAFRGLSNLSFLHIGYNSVPTIPPGLFDEVVNLENLELQYNNISSLSKDIFKNLAYLQILYLNDNKISSVADRIFPSNMTWLQKLNISNNPLMTDFPLPKNGFPFLHTFAMKNLPLMYNVPSIIEIPRIQFVYMTYPYHCCIYKDHLPEELLITPKLVKVKSNANDDFTPPFDVEVHGNGSHVDVTIEHESDETILVIVRPSAEPLTLPPHVLEGHLFPELQDPYNPKDHDITQEDIDYVLKEFAQQSNLSIRILPNNEINIIGVENGTEVVLGGLNEESVKRLFSRLPVFNDISQVYCEPVQNAFMPCESLLDPDPVRVLVWIVWFPAILGNIAVIFVTLASTEKVDVPSFILCNLALADFMLGIFLSFLGVVDVRTFGEGSFYKSALHWQKGPGCLTAGFIGVFANELSVYLMVVLTLERLHTIVYSFEHQGSRMKMRHAVVLVLCGWIFAGVAASLPLFDINSYTEVSICLPFRTEYLRDKIYIGTLFCLSVVAFLAILFSYVHILVIYCKLPANEKRLQERITTSIKMGALVLSNCVCWLPLAVLGLAALGDIYLINLTAAKYFIVLVFPLNACLNPFLYTISKKTFWDRCRSICKKTDQRFQEVTMSSRTRRSSLASASTTSSHHDPDIDFDLLHRRQSRRSLSLQMESSPTIVHSTHPVPVVPHLGRRNSSPAIFGVDNGLTDSRKVGIKLPSDPTLVDSESRFSVLRTQTEFNRTPSKCLSVVHEETSLCASDDEYNDPQSPFRFSAELRALHRANSDTANRHRLSDYVRRDVHQLCDDDNKSDISSSSEYDDARSSPSPHCIIDSLDSTDNRYSSSTTDSYSVVSRNTHRSTVTRLINPHAQRPSHGAVESSC